MLNDIKIIFNTVKVVLKREGFSEGSDINKDKMNNSNSDKNCA